MSVNSAAITRYSMWKYNETWDQMHFLVKCCLYGLLDII